MAEAFMHGSKKFCQSGYNTDNVFLMFVFNVFL